jgi:hypothetical protein
MHPASCAERRKTHAALWQDDVRLITRAEQSNFYRRSYN